MDKGKLVRLVLIPIIIGLVVTLIVRQVLSPAEAASAGGSAEELVGVVVVAAKQPIPAKTKITEQHLVMKQVPKSVLMGSEFAEVKDAVGQTSEVVLQPGEIVLKTRLVPEGKGSMAYRIPEGYRAITVRVDELAGVAGHPKPGDLIDLILFLQASKERPTATARIMYEAVQVLGVGPALPTESGVPDGQGPKLTSFTLAMKPDQVVEVTLAEQMGYIKAVLRPAVKEGNHGRLQFSESNWK